MRRSDKKLWITIAVAITAGAAGLSMNSPAAWWNPLMWIHNLNTAANVLFGVGVYIMIIIVPTVIHANEMIHNLEDRIRSGVPWTEDFLNFLMHTFATLFFMVLMVLAPVILFLSQF